MVSRPTAKESAAYDLEELRRSARTVPLADPSYHSPPTCHGTVTRVTLGRSRMRESRTYGSVRAKSEWLSYSTSLATP